MPLGIFAHAERGGEIHDPRPVEAVEIGIEQCAQDLARPVGPEVRHEHTVAVIHAAVFTDWGRPDEFVGFAGKPSELYGLSDRILPRAQFAFPVHQRRIGICGAFPALVPVHRVVAAGHRRNPDRAGACDGVFEVLDEFFRASRRGIPAVEKGVDGDRYALQGKGFRHSRHMVLVGMDAARRQQAHDMGGAAGGNQRLGEPVEGRQFGQRAVGDRRVDLRQILLDDPAGADRHVADFGIAHLAVRQPDMMFGSVAERVRAGRRQPVPDRRLRPGDGVVRGFGAMAPAVQDAQDNRAGRIGAGRACVGHRRTGWKG